MPAQALLLTSWVRYSFYLGSPSQQHISVQHVQQSPEQVTCHTSSFVGALSDVQYSLSAPHPCMHRAFVPAQDGLLALLVSRQHLPTEIPVPLLLQIVPVSKHPGRICQ